VLSAYWQGLQQSTVNLAWLLDVAADFDVEAEADASHSQDSDFEVERKKMVKHAKRRWTHEESKLLYTAFGKDMTMPSGTLFENNCCMLKH